MNVRLGGLTLVRRRAMVKQFFFCRNRLDKMLVHCGSLAFGWERRAKICK